MPKHRPTTSPIRSMTDLVADPHNANLGTTRGREALAQSLRDYGPGRAVLIDRNGVVLAGNKTVEQARKLNIPLRVVQTDGHHLVAVQRLDLDLSTDPRARALAIADNRVGELDLEWDLAMLKQLQADGLDLSAFWTNDEFTKLFAEETKGLTDENAVVEPGRTDIARGDFFALGPHRLLCGDATDAADVVRLLGDVVPVVMACDPPYGVQYDPAWRHRAFPNQRTAIGAVANDTDAAWPGAFKLFPGPVVYAWHAAPSTAIVATTLTLSGFVPRAQIIWVKQHFALSRGDYHWQHEPCWYAVRKGGKSHWQGDRTQSTVWSVPNLNVAGGTRNEEEVRTAHATQKPVRLFEIPISNHTTPGQGVYDPFVGSGTTLIAAEKTNRVAFVMDVDPQYVQVAMSRWEQFTGKRARRLGRRTAGGRS
jgi:DNA modification methylase